MSPLMHFVFALLCATLVLASPSSGDSTSVSEAPHADSLDSPRHQFQYQVDENQIQAQAELKYGENSQKLHLAASQDKDGCRFVVKFYSRAADAETEVRLKFRLKEMFEFSYTAGQENAPFDNTQTVVHNYTNWQWDAIADESPAGTNQKQYRFATTNGAVNVIAKFNYNYVNGSVSVSANDIKFDVKVDNQVLKNTLGWFATATTHVAFKGVIETSTSNEASQSEDSATESGDVAIGRAGSGISFAGLNWVNYVDCGGVKVTLKSSSMTSDNSQVQDSGDSAKVIYWTILDNNPGARSAPCLWDPVIGVTQTGSASSIIASSAMIFLAAIAAFL